MHWGFMLTLTSFSLFSSFNELLLSSVKVDGVSELLVFLFALLLGCEYLLYGAILAGKYFAEPWLYPTSISGIAM